jgi:hypothetical protein
MEEKRDIQYSFAQLLHPAKHPTLVWTAILYQCNGTNVLIRIS